MKTIVSARHFDLTQPLKDFADEKLGQLKKYFDQVIEVDLVLRVLDKGKKKDRQLAEATLWANGAVLHAEAETSDMYASIQGVVDKLEKQLKRYKQKLRDNRHRRGKGARSGRKGNGGANSEPDMTGHDMTHALVALDESDEADGTRVVREGDFVLQPLTVEEASLQLTELDQRFVVFSNLETNQIGVVYRRPDGGIGWIEARTSTPRAGAR